LLKVPKTMLKEIHPLIKKQKGQFMEDFIQDLELEVSALIRNKLETTKDFNFNTGNELDILINDHVDIKYICFKAEEQEIA
jgi:non-homologous end joining protein Ku